MTSNESGEQAVIKKKKRISGIWALPIVALLIGLSLAYQAWQDSGVMISISFENANGLEVKKTKLKFKDVNIGTLESIEFSDDDGGIVAQIEVERDMERFLRSDSQFWVVRPRIGSGGISGISTLLSGAYIAIQPGKEQLLSTSFTGLESPPISNPNDEGLKLTLVSTGGKQLREGNPVLYRGFEVGVVETINFDIDSREISYDIFIQAPYHNLVTTNTYFWNAGGVELTTGAQGVSVNFSSLESFIAGGVQFDIPEDLTLGSPVRESRSFTLYPNRTSTIDDRAYDYLQYVLLISGSISGIEVGSPVEYRGIKIGRVAKPYLGFYETQQIDQHEERIPVVIHIEPKRLTQYSEYDLAWFENQFARWIEDGLAATVETANILTGAMKVSLDMSLEPGNEVERFGQFTVIPVGESGFDGIIEKTDKLLAKLNDLDVESVIVSINRTMTSAQTTMQNADAAIASSKDMIDNINSTMTEAQTALEGMQPGSSVYMELEGNLIKLQQTLDQLQPFIEKVSAQPNLLIFSEDAQADPEPQGK